MEFAVGAVLEGKVKTITKFGAFVELPENKTGMVHISEITHSYVNDIRDHLTEGQEVKVMIIGMENGKINLSIRRTQTPPPRQPSDRPRPAFNSRPAKPARPAQPAERQPQTFDDMLKQFMADSDSKISGLYSDHKTKTRRR